MDQMVLEPEPKTFRGLSRSLYFNIFKFWYIYIFNILTNRYFISSKWWYITCFWCFILPCFLFNRVLVYFL